MTLPGGAIRASSVVHLAFGSFRRHLLRGAALGLVAAVAAGAVVGTSGRTDVSRQSILVQLASPSARLITITAGDQTLGSPTAIDRIAALSSVEWVLGLSKPGSVGRNLGLGSARTGYAGTAAGTLDYWGDLLGGPLLRQMYGRAPATGEALVGQRASLALGLADHVGGISDDLNGPVAVVGEFRAADPVGNLDAYALVRAPANREGLYQVLILARDASSVEALATLVPALLPPSERPPAVERASQLLTLRAALISEVGQLDVAVLAASLGSSILIVAVMVYASVQERRREFGLRRTQGATRSTIGVLVLLESAALAFAGSVIGTAIAYLAVTAQTGLSPDLGLVLSGAVLVALAGCVGSVPSALLASYREPLYVLRAE